MATVTYVFTINHVAKKLGEDPELLEADRQQFRQFDLWKYHQRRTR